MSFHEVPNFLRVKRWQKVLVPKMFWPKKWEFDDALQRGFLSDHLYKISRFFPKCIYIMQNSISSKFFHYFFLKLHIGPVYADFLTCLGKFKSSKFWIKPCFWDQIRGSKMIVERDDENQSFLFLSVDAFENKNNSVLCQKLRIWWGGQIWPPCHDGQKQRRISKDYFRCNSLYRFNSQPLSSRGIFYLFESISI